MGSDWHGGPSVNNIARADIETHIADTGRQLPQPLVDRAVSLTTAWYRDALKHGVELRTLHHSTNLAAIAVHAVALSEGRKES